MIFSVDHLTLAFLSYNTLNPYTLINTGSLAVEVGLLGRVIFAGVGLFPGICGISLSVPANSIQDILIGMNISQPTGGKDPPRTT